MHHNGKTPHRTGDTLTLQGTPAEAQGTPAEAQGTPAEAKGTPAGAKGMTAGLQGTPAEAQGMIAGLQGTPAEAQGTPAGAKETAFGANASIAKRLAGAQLAIDAVLADGDLQLALAAYGYGAARMAEGKALRDQAQALQQQQRLRYGDRYRAADAHAGAQAQTRLAYTQHRSVARVALRGDRGAAQMLGLDSPLPTTQAGWLLQAQQFYANALADTAIQGALASYNLTRAHLAAGQAQVAGVAAGTVARQAARSAAQAGTHTRDAALQALNRWMRDFLAIARIALADQPQRLAQLGVKGS